MAITYDEMMKLFQETREQVREQAKTFDRELRESREAFGCSLRDSKEEADRQMQALRKQMGELSGRLGQFVEAMVQPALVPLFQARGIEVHEVHRYVSAQRAEGSVEIDLLVVNDGDVIAVECKSRLSIDDINEHLERMDKIKTLLPAYRDKRLLGAVATMVLEDNVGRYAYSKGLYVLAQSGESVVIKNDANFRPHYW